MSIYFGADQFLRNDFTYVIAIAPRYSVLPDSKNFWKIKELGLLVPALSLASLTVSTSTLTSWPLFPSHPISHPLPSITHSSNHSFLCLLATHLLATWSPTYPLLALPPPHLPTHHSPVPMPSHSYPLALLSLSTPFSLVPLPPPFFLPSNCSSSHSPTPLAPYVFSPNPKNLIPLLVYYHSGNRP